MSWSPIYRDISLTQTHGGATPKSANWQNVGQLLQNSHPWFFSHSHGTSLLTERRVMTCEYVRNQKSLLSSFFLVKRKKRKRLASGSIFVRTTQLSVCPATPQSPSEHEVTATTYNITSNHLAPKLASFPPWPLASLAVLLPPFGLHLSFLALCHHRPPYPSYFLLFILSESSCCILTVALL